MDLLDKNSGITLNDSAWKISARNSAEPPHYVGEHGILKNSIVSEGCEIDGALKNSVLSHSSTVGRGAVIENTIVMPGAVIDENVVIKYAIIGAGAHIERGARVGEDLNGPGADGEWEIALIGPDKVVGENAVVKKGEMV
jgi:glucose-1-phosphate adenylyltransferase